MKGNPNSLEAPRYLKTCLKGGIGDCIKHLTCNFALPSLYKNYGTQIFVTYEGFGVNPEERLEKVSSAKIAELENSGSPWGHVLRENILEKAPFLISVSSRVFNSLTCDTVNSWFDAFGPQLYGKLEDLLPLELNSPPAPPLSKKYRNIGIQLSSNEESKMWGLDNWQSLIGGILAKYKGTCIYLIDEPCKQNSINKNYNLRPGRLINAAGKPLAETIDLISRLDLLIAPDSFSKYVALCNKVPSIILCCELDYMSPSDMFRSCFLSEISYNDNFKLLGVDLKENFTVNHIVKGVKEITVEEVLHHV